MDKRDIVNEVVRRKGVDTTTTEYVLEGLLEVMFEELAAGHTLQLRPVGCLYFQKVPALVWRRGKPDEYIIPEHRRIRFRPSPKLKPLLNPPDYTSGYHFKPGAKVGRPRKQPPTETEEE